MIPRSETSEKNTVLGKFCRARRMFLVSIRMPRNPSVEHSLPLPDPNSQVPRSWDESLKGGSESKVSILPDPFLDPRPYPERVDPKSDDYQQ